MNRQDLSPADILHHVSSQLIAEDKVEALYEAIVDGAALLMRADFASMQRLHPQRGPAGELELLATRGFDPEATRFWKWVRADSNCSCGEAMRRHRRALIPDIETCEFMAGTPDLEAYRAAGIGAAHSTPLFSRTGRLLGMISTHWARPHQPAAAELQLFDILARQAADLIERTESEQALRLSDRRKDEFLAVLSHELRNPLAPIRNAVQILCAAGDDRETREGACRILERQVAHTVRLVDDLLELSRINLGQITLRHAPTDLATVVEAAVEISRPGIERAGLELALDVPGEGLSMLGDPVRLSQVVANILNNAVKYTPSGGRITVRARNDGDGHAVLSIRDTGAGIPPDMIERVFDTFAQVDARLKRVQGGLGVGLSLSRRLVEMHGGRIEARSEGAGRGAEFILTLPLRVVDAAVGSSAPTLRSSSVEARRAGAAG